MYTQRNTARADSEVYIPPNYRGNALYFERIAEREEEGTADGRCDDSGHAESHESAPDTCAVCHGTEQGTSLSGALGKLLKGDTLVILAVAAFLLFSGKDKRSPSDSCRPSVTDDSTLLFLLLLLLL